MAEGEGSPCATLQGQMLEVARLAERIASLERDRQRQNGILQKLADLVESQGQRFAQELRATEDRISAVLGALDQRLDQEAQDRGQIRQHNTELLNRILVTFLAGCVLLLFNLLAQFAPYLPHVELGVKK